MSQVTFKGEPVSLSGTFPKVGDTVNNFQLTTNEFKETSLDEYKDQQLILNIFPSIDTPVCSSSVIRFNDEAGNLKNTLVLCISKDLPFAQARFCGAENIEKVKTLSAFRDSAFAKQFGVDIASSILKGLLARAIVVLDAKRKVIYTELVSEITNKPDYEKCLAAINAR